MVETYWDIRNILRATWQDPVYHVFDRWGHFLDVYFYRFSEAHFDLMPSNGPVPNI